MKITAPRKRDKPLYCRISPENKAWLDTMADIHDCTVAAYLDHMIDSVRIEMAFLEAVKDDEAIAK